MSIDDADGQTPEMITKLVREANNGGVARDSDASLKDVFQAVCAIRAFGDNGRPYCKTTLCMAGWAAYLNPQALLTEVKGRPVTSIFDPTMDWQYIGGTILGLDEETADKLFHEGGWPQDVQTKLDRARERARTELAQQKTSAKWGAYLLREIAAGRDPWKKDKY